MMMGSQELFVGARVELGSNLSLMLHLSPLLSLLQAKERFKSAIWFGFWRRSHPAGFRESLWVVLGDHAVPETNPGALTCRTCSPAVFRSYFPAPQDYFLYKFPTSSLTDSLLLPANFGKEQFLRSCVAIPQIPLAFPRPDPE